MLPFSLEEKLIAAGLAVSIVVASIAYYSLHLINVGKDECITQTEELRLKAEDQANALETTWRGRLNDAQLQHQAELESFKTQYIAGPLPPVRVRYVSPGASGVPGSPGATDRATPASSANVCQPLVPESSDALQRDFENAVAADRLLADYRLLYTSWPQKDSK